MKIKKDIYLQNVKFNHPGLIVIPTVCLYTDDYVPPKGLIQEYQDFPDNFFMILKDGRLAFGKEDGFLFLSKIGFLCLVDEIYEKLVLSLDEHINYVEKEKNNYSAEQLKYALARIDKCKKLTRDKYVDFMLKEFEKVEIKTVKYFSKNKDKRLKSFVFK